MPFRLSPTLLLPAVLGAAIAAYVVTDRAPPTAAAAPESTVVAAATESPAGPSPAALPPNHPAVPGAATHGGPLNGDNQQPPAVTWTAPATWQTQPNPNSMRLATYKVGDGAEASVVRAGGSVDANVKRWSDQFEGSPAATRSQRQVHGLPVTVVRIDGVFLGAGMGAAPEKHDGWSMVAAIVESPGSPYFFKLLGPRAQVDKARASFDGLVDSVTPRVGE